MSDETLHPPDNSPLENYSSFLEESIEEANRQSSPLYITSSDFRRAVAANNTLPSRPSTLSSPQPICIAIAILDSEPHSNNSAIRSHISHLSASPIYTITALLHSTPSGAETSKESLNLDSTVRLYDSPTHLADSNNVDLVAIFGSGSSHHAIALDILQAGKPIFLPSPPMKNVSQMEGLLDAARKSGVEKRCFVGVPIIDETVTETTDATSVREIWDTLAHRLLGHEVGGEAEGVVNLEKACQIHGLIERTVRDLDDHLE